MTSQNPDGVDAFLESLGLKAEQPAQKQLQQQGGQGLQVRVMLAGLPNFELTVHCFVLDTGVAERDLEGRLLRGQWTFRTGNLAKFCELYEKMLDDCEINYHRSLQVPPGPDQNIFSYRLVKPLNDPRGYSLLQTVEGATILLHKNLSQG